MFVLTDPDTRHAFTSPGWPGVTFSLRSIPRGKWAYLRNSLLLSTEKARRRAVRELAAEGSNPDEPKRPGSKFSLADFRASIDPELGVEQTALNGEIVRWGLVAAAGVTFPEGTDGFEFEEIQHEGVAVKVLAPAAVRLLSAQPGLVVVLANRIWELNELGPDEKKD